MDATTACQREHERQLISRAIEGDQQAFAELFEAHRNHVYSLYLRMTGNVAEAEDLTQDAFIQVFRKLATFRGDAALSTWIYRVAVNTALMHFRKKSLCQVSLEPRPDAPKERREFCQHDGRLRDTVDRIALTRAISELPHGYRTIFLLHDVEGYGHQEIAELLKCSVGNSKSQLHKARLRIRESLLAGSKAAETQPVPDVVADAPSPLRLVMSPVSASIAQEETEDSAVPRYFNNYNQPAVA